MYSACGVQKTSFFTGFCGPSPSPGLHLGDVKNPCRFFHGFGSSDGVRKKSENFVSADVLAGLGANIGPTSAKMWATWVNIRLR